MKKKIILLTALSLITLTACQNAKTTTKASITTTTNQTTTVDTTTANTTTNQTTTVGTTTANTTTNQTTTVDTTTVNTTTNQTTTVDTTTLNTTTENTTTVDVTTTSNVTTSNTTTTEVLKGTVTLYEDDKTTLIGSYNYVAGQTLGEVLPTPVKLGYSFDGWTQVNGKAVPLDRVLTTAVNMNLYAKYSKLSLTLGEVLNYTPEAAISSKGLEYYNLGNDYQKTGFNDQGYAQGHIADFSQYEGTSAYTKVTTADELINALLAAQNEYESNFIYDDLTALKEANISEYEALMEERAASPSGKSSNETRRLELEAIVNGYNGHLEQKLTKPQTVHVIEIAEDINLGYNVLSSKAKESGIVEDWNSVRKNYPTMANGFIESNYIKENGISKIKVSKSTDLLIYSKNSSKITNAGFSVSSCEGVVFRNLDMDGLWQWEDSPSSSAAGTIGDMDAQGWAYFKISNSGHVWIDHCSFGKSYDGQIDISNPYFYNRANGSYAPYGVPLYYEEESVGYHISNCDFHAGSDDKNGYLYKMMEEIENDYQNNSSSLYSYYKLLRGTYNLSFEEILYGIAIPQKKAFLDGDSSNTWYNDCLRVSYANNIFKNIEDRIPNVRGGVGYMYNCIVDNRQYFEYRNTLVSKNVKSISSNGKYKCGMVSQGIVVGYGASVCAENCVFLGVSELYKNNNASEAENYIKKYNPATGTNFTIDDVDASVNITNCIWMNSNYDNLDLDITDSLLEVKDDYILSQENTVDISTEKFNWHNDTNTKPFEPNYYVKDCKYLSGLFDYLLGSQRIGANPNYEGLYLYTNSIIKA